MMMPTPRIRIGLLAVFGAAMFAGGLHAQRVDARDHLLYPTNPPRPVGSAPIRFDEKGHSLLIELQIMELEKAGLPKSDPILQSLYAQRAQTLSKMQTVEPSSEKEEDLKRKLAEALARTIADNETRRREIESLKKEISRLEEENKKLRGN